MKRKLLLSLAVASVLGWPVWAADHAETPTVTADPAADIADVFIFRPDQASPRVVVAMTFAGRPVSAAGGVRIDGPVMRCDPNVLYEFNIDNNSDGKLDAQANIRVLARLARNLNGQCGVKIENVPGMSGPIMGREGAVLTDSASGLRAFAGLIDDPFFFGSQPLCRACQNNVLTVIVRRFRKLRQSLMVLAAL